MRAEVIRFLEEKQNEKVGRWEQGLPDLNGKDMWFIQPIGLQIREGDVRIWNSYHLPVLYKFVPFDIALEFFKGGWKDKSFLDKYIVPVKRMERNIITKRFNW